MTLAEVISLLLAAFIVSTICYLPPGGLTASRIYVRRRTDAAELPD